MRILHAQFVQRGRAERRDQLRAGRVLAIEEVVGALHRDEAAADVRGDEVVEEHVAHRQAVAALLSW